MAVWKCPVVGRPEHQTCSHVPRPGPETPAGAAITKHGAALSQGGQRGGASGHPGSSETLGVQSQPNGWVQIPAPPLPGCVTLGKLLHFSVGESVRGTDHPALCQGPGSEKGPCVSKGGLGSTGPAHGSTLRGAWLGRVHLGSMWVGAEEGQL